MIIKSFPGSGATTRIDVDLKQGLVLSGVQRHIHYLTATAGSCVACDDTHNSAAEGSRHQPQ